MRRISSRATFFYKRVFPIIWFGFLSLFVAIPLIVGSRSGQFPPASFLIMPAVMVVVSYLIFKKLIFELVDEILDGGDALIVRNKNQEARIALSDIVNVSYSPFGGAYRVTLLLRKPSIFGTRIHFCPPIRFLAFLGSPIVDELIERIDTKRRI